MFSNQGFPVWFLAPQPVIAAPLWTWLQSEAPTGDACLRPPQLLILIQWILQMSRIFPAKLPQQGGSRPQLCLRLPSYLLLKEVTQKWQTFRLHRSGFPSAEPNSLKLGKPCCHWLVQETHQNPTRLPREPESP